MELNNAIMISKAGDIVAYSELIKDFSRIREYMRQFYVFGFKTRDEYDSKSARSYDNEKRRMESWLGEYMSFRQEGSGKVSFISVDTRQISHNPLYNAFKAKGFTSNDIVLFFYIMDILEEYDDLSAAEIANYVMDDYLAEFDESKIIDESTIRKKLKEYEQIGLLESTKSGRKLIYNKVRDSVNLDSWSEAIAFFSEVSPIGVIGSYLLDKADAGKDFFIFKHHYILHALESEIMYKLLDAISDECEAEIQLFSKRKQKIVTHVIIPVKIYISTQNGRCYVLGLDNDQHDKQFNMYRLDNVRNVSKGDPVADIEKIKSEASRFTKYMWNTSSSKRGTFDHITVIFRIKEEDVHILNRIKREANKGSIVKIENDRYQFDVDIYDVTEIRPWLRTFIGRIESISSTSEEFVEQFYTDLDAMYAMYGG